MRTLDIGGDKDLPYFPIDEANPFLGWRGIRVTLDHPEVLMVQLRAMLRASQGLDNLQVLLPMVTNVSEVDDALRLLERAISELGEEGVSVARPRVGVMIEVPATLYQLEALARRVDFFSVGSNDLTQYLLAVDRNNPRVAELYDACHPAVLSALSRLAVESRELGVPASVCGELAGDPAGALLLMGMGFEALSMNAPSLPKVRAAVRRVSLEAAQQLVEDTLLLDCPWRCVVIWTTAWESGNWVTCCRRRIELTRRSRAVIHGVRESRLSPARCPVGRSAARRCRNDRCCAIRARWWLACRSRCR
ncbi:phosphoenolpyruvate-protein phosphotransferase [Halomonas elongata]|uniref:Phosphoenolpyruvate-protein phosphotransferase n=1 Tax=Halomonas elongata TaxID=2746 RepID=A0A1B8P5P6_HALEL|nr:phosphoenolpyruvate-protein phosphotransferase [Halomonas elongata]